jgi:hypothetical protein
MQATVTFKPHDIQQGDGQAGNSARTAISVRKPFFKLAANLMAAFLVMATLPGILHGQLRMSSLRKLSFQPVRASTRNASGIVSELANISWQREFVEQFSSKLVQMLPQNMSGIVSRVTNVSVHKQADGYPAANTLRVCNYGSAPIRAIFTQEPDHANSLITGPWVAMNSCYTFDQRQLSRQWLDGATILFYYQRTGDSRLYRTVKVAFIYQRNSNFIGEYACSGSPITCSGPQIRRH